MKKLKLDLEDLTVESFSIEPTTDFVGTVNANEATDLCSVSCTDPFSTLYKAARTFSMLC